MCGPIADRATALERAGRDVIHLERGEVGLPVATTVREAAVEALATHHDRYTDSAGLPELRTAIADHYRRRHGVDVTPSRVLVGSGSSPAMLVLFLGLLSPGDEVIVPGPCYPAYPRLAEVAGARAVAVPTARDRFHYRPDAVRERISSATRAVLVNFPSNPVGAAIDGPGLAAFGRLGPLVVSDEAYLELAEDEACRHSILEYTDEAVVVGSFSKGFAMSGWRLGYLVLPEWLAPRVMELHESFFICTNAFVQLAGVRALAAADELLPAVRAELRARRTCLLEGLARVGLEVPHEPRGGLHVFARLPDGAGPADPFVRRLLEETGVAIRPGTEFGPDGEGHVRFSCSAPCERIGEAIERLTGHLDSLDISEYPYQNRADPRSRVDSRPYRR